MLSKRLIAPIMLSFLSVSILTGAFRIQFARALPFSDRVDNLVITTSDLEAAASRLAQWKNSCGIPSKVLNVSWIYSHYEGVDEPEKIRNCIKDYHSNFGIEYVTIFGDTDKVPIRYVYVPDTVETEIPTDLYYADLNYSWDDNHDGVYGDLGNDTVEGLPDVYVGRIPASYNNTAEDVVTKIIQYKDNFNPGDEWVKRIVLAAGDSDGDMPSGFSDFVAEYVTHLTLQKNDSKLYHSFGNLTTGALASQIDDGCFFLNYAGHSGNGLIEELLGIVPEAWFFYWRLFPLIYEGFGWQDALDRTNSLKLPVVVTMACSSAKVDWTSSLGDLLRGECLGEYFVMNPHGGAIAYFGSTGIAWAPDQSYGAWQELMTAMDLWAYRVFYYGYTHLGAMWGESITRYIQEHELDEIFYNNSTRLGYLNEKTVMEFMLLGDPTLRIYDGPRTLNVPEDYPSIQSAINDAYEGDTVYVKNGMYYENLIVNKTINLRGESRESTVVDGSNTGNVVTLVSNNANVSGFTFQHSAGALYSCIRLDQVSGCSIFSDIANNSNSGASGDGIFLQSSDKNNISDNLVINNWDGITFWGSSNNTISGNTVVNLVNVGGTSIQFAYGSRFNLAFGNAFLGIAQIGIRCYQSDSGSNVLVGNKVENHYFGIYADGSSNNIFYHNSIVNSTINQAYISGVNVWDNGYPSGGNYWSDYTSTDFFSGPYQNETGSDGIGDTSCLIDANNTDRYPLMNPWTPPDAAALNILSSKTIVGEGFSTNVTVFLENQGSKIEELNATFYANETFIGYQTFMLRSNNSIIYSSNWNLSSLAKGNYSLSIYIAPLEGETDLNDNSLSGRWIFISIPGDLNGDKIVDIYDAIILANHFEFDRYHPSWDSNVDINNDGIIDIFDAIVLAANYGKSWT